MSVGWGPLFLHEETEKKKKKLHKWEVMENYELTPRDRAKHDINHSFHHRKCKNCGLQKFSKRYERNKYETFYFTVGDDGYIIDNSFRKGTLPYSCGYKEKMLLTDKDFEIDI